MVLPAANAQGTLNLSSINNGPFGSAGGGRDSIPEIK